MRSLMFAAACVAALSGCASTEPGQKVATYEEPPVSVASRIPRKDPKASGVVHASKEELENARLIGGSAINGMDAGGR